MGFQLPSGRGPPLQLMAMASTTYTSGQRNVVLRLEATDTFPGEQGPATCLAVAWSPQVTRPVVLPLSSLCEALLDGSSFIEHLSAPWGGSIVPIREPGSSRTR